MICRISTFLQVLLLPAFFIALGGCDNSRREPVTYPTNTNQPAEARRVPPPTSKDWATLASRVPNRKEREKQIEQLLEKAEEARREYEAASVEERKKHVARVKELKQQAGDIYDQLREDADRIDPQLWNQQFRSLQNRWDTMTKKLRRIGM